MQLYHINKCLKVNRIAEQELKAECIVLSREQETAAWIVTDIKDLKIKYAGWTRYRSVEGTVAHHDVPELIGIEAYLYSGPQLKQVLAEKEPEQARELFSECIRGIVQAETFFVQERGFTTINAHVAFWDEMYFNQCRLFRNPAQREQPWVDYVGCVERPYNLFNRVHNVTIYKENDNGYLLLATFIDSFHELGIRLEIGPDRVIRRAEGDFIRAPDRVCKENTCHLEKLLGLSITGQSRKDFAALAGGRDGCDHVVDILYDACQALEVVWNDQK